ncbi:MAG: DUF3419 family protein [Rhodothermaceae bacterium]|nr:DUF3419 family protein [Rhodothermaceae bacterium]MXX59363.1 DUF3419 family protein [Rhodothermaceae bacterium]MYD18265.1 DUF3419 family protein [Rhodothermaceae bacterium]MYD57714.1 DUF3419 family protein [Rhodothermaceae bacterium]MYI43723.1 DUF3419 family protein [Rhodothermaceae bacterium]
MSTEAAARADFSFVRYAQCWEDADILLEALDVAEGDVCLSIASAGENSLSLLSCKPARVIAVDMNPAQLACLALRVAAYRVLSHEELLQLIGSRECGDREALYRRCRGVLEGGARDFWDARPQLVQAGIGNAGKFEDYFAVFRRKVLPWIHPRHRVEQLLAGGAADERRHFYTRHWANRRWELLFRLFFSRFVMGRMGRDPEFFRYVEGSVSERILARARHALTELDPAANPYLQWILTGRHTTALPHALRRENFDIIRENLDRLEWHCLSIEELLDAEPELLVDCHNLSDIFEYMSDDYFHELLSKLTAHSRDGARLAYWNMLVPRSRPPELASKLIPNHELAERLHLQDKAFFYSRFVVETVAGGAGCLASPDGEASH